MSPLLLAFAVSVAAPGFEDLDAGPSSDAVADVAWVGDGKAQAVWVNARRDLAFRMDRRRGADLWTNHLLPDGGLQRMQGEILCPTSPTEFFSSPRIASNRVVTWVAWKVSTADRDLLRASELSALGAADCAGTVYDPGPGGRFTGLQLEESQGAFMALFETATHFVAMPLDGATQAIVLLYAKTPGSGAFGRYDPSLGPRLGGGFTVAWAENGVLVAQDIDALGRLSNAYVTPWLGIGLSASPVVVGPPARLAALGQSANDTGGPLVKVGSVLSTPVDGPPNVTRLLASSELTNSTDMTQARVRVFGQAGQVWGLTDFTPASSSTALLAQGITPLAVAGAFNRTAAFADLGGEAGFMTWVGPSISGNTASVHLKSDTSQLLPSVLWLDAGVFAVSYMEGLALQAGTALPAAPGVITNVSAWANDGGVYRFHPRASGPGVAVSVQTGNVSTLALTTFSQGQLPSATPFLTVAAPGFDEAVVGETAALFWARGGASYAAGQGAPSPFTSAGVRMGRCGAKVADYLLAPYVIGSDLKIISLLDQPSQTPASRAVRSDALGVEPPCLAAWGREVLIVANDDAGNLRAWKTTIDDVLQNRPAVEVSLLPPQPNARGVKNPVVIGTAAGWQLAWEATDQVGNQLYESTWPFDGGVPQSGPLTVSLDDRVPLLAASPSGEVVVVWQQFIDNRGAVVVRARRVDRAASLPDGGLGDAGVVRPDGGLPGDGGIIIIDDGGVVFDGGVPDGGTPDGGARDGGREDAGVADAGLSPDAGADPGPLSFSACGCGPSGDPALALFGVLLFFAARRRRAASP